MKKLIVALCVLTVLFSITACGTNASDKAVSVAKSAIEIADKYLDNEISYSEASEAIDELEEDMEYVDDLDHGDKYHAADSSISIKLFLLSTCISSDNYQNTSDSYNEVLEARNKLADDAGLKKR